MLVTTDGMNARLTGFDAPSMHTMHVDKPMRGHGLMQAIARVNRVFRDKPAGLVVDYIGIARNLKAALARYSPADRQKTGIDETEAVAVLQGKLEIVRAMFHGFDLTPCLNGTPQERLAGLAGAEDWIPVHQQEAAAREKTEPARKAALRRFQDAVLALSRAYTLASASDAAQEVREEIAVYQTIRAALVKSADPTGRTAVERDFAIRQIVNQAVVPAGISDILKAAGLQAPDISILSDEFLAEMAKLPQQNLALEALRKLIEGEIRSRSAGNLTGARKFSERLEEAIARYHSNAITTAEILQELIAIAKRLREARLRGEELGLSPEEIAFYDALAENESAMELMGGDELKVIAVELLKTLRANASVDWAHREASRARLRTLVKRILRRYGYPPDLQDAAVRGVLAQAEAVMAWEFAR